MMKNKQARFSDGQELIDALDNRNIVLNPSGQLCFRELRLYKIICERLGTPRTNQGRFNMQTAQDGNCCFLSPMTLRWGRNGWIIHLKDNWADHRECHIGGDFLLIYEL